MLEQRFKSSLQSYALIEARVKDYKLVWYLFENILIEFLISLERIRNGLESILNKFEIDLEFVIDSK